MSKKKKPIDEYKAQYDEALRKEIDTRMTHMRELVDGVLSDAAFEIIANAIGMTKDRWNRGQWTVDHCNGRRTAAANALGEHALEYVKSQLPDFVAQFANVPKKLSASMKKEYRDVYDRKLREVLTAHAEEQARKDADELLNALKGNSDDEE